MRILILAMVLGFVGCVAQVKSIHEEIPVRFIIYDSSVKMPPKFTRALKCFQAQFFNKRDSILNNDANAKG